MEALLFCIDSISDENTAAKEILYLSIKKSIPYIVQVLDVGLPIGIIFTINVEELIRDYLKFLRSLVKCLKRQLFRDRKDEFLDTLKRIFLSLSNNEFAYNLKTLQGRSMYEEYMRLLQIIINDSSKDMTPLFSDLFILIINLEKIFEFQNVCLHY